VGGKRKGLCKSGEFEKSKSPLNPSLQRGEEQGELFQGRGSFPKSVKS